MVMMTIFGEVAQQPRIGITGFAPGGQTKTFVKLTGKGEELAKGVKSVDVFGPVGEEEWAGGIEATIKASDWRPANEKSRRVIVLITDEPMTPAQQEKTSAVVKQAASAGFRVYAVLVFPLQAPPDPLAEVSDRASLFDPGMSSERRAAMVRARGGGGRGGRVLEGIKVYEDLMALSGGQAILTRVPQGLPGLGTLPSVVGPPRAQVAVDPHSIAPVYPYGGPTAHLLTVVLSDAINPQYAKRVGPLVQILAAHSQRVAWVPEARSN
jgi:hypothetical protein